MPHCARFHWAITPARQDPILGIMSMRVAIVILNEILQSEPAFIRFERLIA